MYVWMDRWMDGWIYKCKRRSEAGQLNTDLERDNVRWIDKLLVKCVYMCMFRWVDMDG